MGENKYYTVRPKTGKTATANISSNFATNIASITISSDINNSVFMRNNFERNLYPLVNLNIPEIDKGNKELIDLIKGALGSQKSKIDLNYSIMQAIFISNNKEICLS